MEQTRIVEHDRSDANRTDGDTDGDDVRRGVRNMWAAVAGRWGEHADYVDARGAAVTAKMLELTDPQPGERVLELACGVGSVGLVAAERVGPQGEVVLSDAVAEMTAIAATRAAARDLGNVTTRVLDLEQIDEPEGAYDVVVCRDGLMFASDPGRAVREIRRVLRPDGRVALAVWGPRERNPWLGVVFDAVSAQIGAPVPPPGVPGPFSLSEAHHLAALMSGAQLADVVVEEFATPLRASSLEEWWTRTSALAGPLANMVAALPSSATQELHARLRTAVEVYATPAGLEFPGVNLLASGRNPSP